MITNKYSLRSTVALALLLNIVIGLQGNTPLSPQAIDIRQLEKNITQLLNTSDISLQELRGGLTNTTFLATNQEDTFVVRIGKENPEILGIDRYCEDACQKSASQIGISPTIIYSDPKNGTLIRSFIKGKPLTSNDIHNPLQLKNIIQMLKKCHQIPRNNECVTTSIYEKIRAMMSLSSSYKPPFFTLEEMEIVRGTINLIEAHFHEKEQMYAGLCHCDLLPGNFIDDGNQLWLIDWEYANWDNILFDLADLCVESDFDEQETQTVLELYFGQSWRDHYEDYRMMRAIFNLRNAFWYDLRGKEIASIGECTMVNYAKKHFDLFKRDAEKSFTVTNHQN
jgi:thiamine kinase-like enzyme